MFHKWIKSEIGKYAYLYAVIKEWTKVISVTSIQTIRTNPGSNQLPSFWPE